MRVLGLDPSLRDFGWVLYDSELHSCDSRGRFQTFSSDLFVSRYMTLRESLSDLIQETKPDCVGIEYPIFNDLYSEGMYGLFLFSCEALYQNNCDVVFFSPNQVKAHARWHLERPSDWKMTKPDMIEAAKSFLVAKGRWSHHEADAFWVAHAAFRFWSLQKGLIGPEDLNEIEAHQFLKMRTITRGKRKGLVERKGILYREDERHFLWSEKDNGEGKI